MKISHKTKPSTKTSTKLNYRAGLLLSLLTLALLLLLLKLGLWQLQKAAEKARWQQQLSQRQAQSSLSYSEFLALDSRGPYTGYRLHTRASPALPHIILLDNQVYRGQVGYLAYQPMEISPAQPWLLLELGFIAATPNRRQLPQIQPIETSISLTGRLYSKQTNPMSDQLMAEAGWPKRIQNLNLTQLAAELNHPIAPAVLQPSKLASHQLPHPWQPIPMPAAKHRGYAIQWFSMAAVFSAIMGYLGIRHLRSIKQAQSKTKII